MPISAIKSHPVQSPYAIDDHESYQEYCLQIIREKSAGLTSIGEIKANEPDINIYPNIQTLEEPRDIYLLDDEAITDAERLLAETAILDGKLFSEHMAAGEATRLGLGAKYLLNIREDLTTTRIAALISNEKDIRITEKNVLDASGYPPESIRSLSLGARHMLQFSYDIHTLAVKHNRNPLDVLSKQQMLLILNETSADEIINEISAFNFFGFARAHVLFMVQQSYHGIGLENGRFFIDHNSPKRLHNHGQIVIQQTMDKQIFRIGDKGDKRFLKREAYFNILETMENKITYNIEDLDFLTGAIDYGAIAFALTQGKKGSRMIMEIVGNDPLHPQKGGMAAYDPLLGRNVMIEGFQLKGIQNKDIHYLNKNINHYPRPAESWSIVKQQGLHMPITVKDGYIYYQPVQGDINFLVQTSFFSRKIKRPIKALKSPCNLPLAIHQMNRQDHQSGFQAYVNKFTDVAMQK
jgi:hypothetical protein